MVNHKKVYINYFHDGEQEFIICEGCFRGAVDIHHLVSRSLGGSDKIENLCAVCRECHDKAHQSVEYNSYLKEKHKQKLLTRI